MEKLINQIEGIDHFTDKRSANPFLEHQGGQKKIVISNGVQAIAMDFGCHGTLSAILCAVEAFSDAESVTINPVEGLLTNNDTGESVPLDEDELFICMVTPQLPMDNMELADTNIIVKRTTGVGLTTYRASLPAEAA